MSVDEQNESEVDGVRVLHFPGPDEICHAWLIFAVGRRDESVPEQGVLHTLEHVVMHAVRRTSVEINASVDAVETQFIASGSPDKVGAFLSQVCRALANPAVDRLPDEVRVLDAERDTAGDSGWPMHRARYGYTDLGVADAIPPATAHLSPELVTRYARTWFVTGNAVLVIDGPMPAQLELPLRSGQAPVRSWPTPRRWAEQWALLTDGPACALNLVLPEVEGSRLDLIAVDVLVDRLTEALRHQGGHTYVIDHALLPVGGGQWDLVVWAEPPEDSAVAAVQTMVTALRQLCSDGPGPAELALAVERLRERSRGRQARVSQAVERAVERLLGVDILPADVDSGAAPEPGEITTYLRTVSRDGLFLGPDEARDAFQQLGLSELTEGPAIEGPLPAGTRYRPPLLARALNGEARGATVVLTESGLVLDVLGHRQELGWPEVVGVARIDDGDMVVFGRHGAAIPIGGGFYRRGKELAAAVVAHVRAELIFPAADLNPETDD